MNTAISLNSSDHSWSRRCSTETILSIQAQETDYARDTSDTEQADSDGEFEPVTEPEDDAPVDDTSADSDNDIISTKVIEVSVGDEGDLVFADSERTDDTQSDSEVDFNDYDHCAQCRAINDSPNYRYCQKCFQVRKSFFPPRPRRKHKRERTFDPDVLNKRSRGIDPDLPGDTQGPKTTLSLSQDSGVDICSQGTSKGSQYENVRVCRGRKRRAESLDRTNTKLAKYSDASDSDNEVKVTALSKCVSDPSVAIENVITKKILADTLKEIETKELCVICVSEPKSGVFVHGRLAHICCCYKCAVKVWVKTKRCPICKRKISNVLRAVVM